jgi:ATP-dependent Clp protease adapter protein ClpS
MKVPLLVARGLQLQAAEQGVVHAHRAGRAVSSHGTRNKARRVADKTSFQT